MQIMYKSKEHLESLLVFVDEAQMESITWLSLIGISKDGYPVLLLDLPSFFQTERDDISEEYSLFVKIANKFPNGYGVLVNSSCFDNIAFSDFSFIRPLYDYLPHNTRKGVKHIWFYNAGIRFRLFVKYCSKFVSSKLSKKITYLKNGKQIQAILSQDVEVTILDNKQLQVSFKNPADKASLPATHSIQSFVNSSSLVISVPDQNPRHISVSIASHNHFTRKRTTYNRSRNPRDLPSIPGHASQQSQGEEALDTAWVFPSLEEQCGEGVWVSPFIQQACDYIEGFGIEEEGLFRSNGNNSLAQSLTQAVLRGESLDAWSYQHHLKIADVCQAIKYYLKYAQLIPFAYYPQVEAARVITDPVQLVEYVKGVLQQLDRYHRETLRRFIVFTGRIMEHAAVNKMNLSNLLMCLQMHICPPFPEEGPFGFGLRTKFIDCLLREGESLFC